MTAHVIRLDNFEGPLDLLLHLIEDRKLEITEISLAEVTDQYLADFQRMRELDLDIASEFAVVAARLLEIKARTLLPSRAEPAAETEDEQETPRDELVRRLLEYRQFKQAAELLARQGEEEGRRYARFPEDLHALEAEIELEGVRLADLLRAVESVLQRAAEEDPALDVRREAISVAGCMRRLVRRLRLAGGSATFQSIFRPESTRLEIVVTFLALLELLRRRRVRVRQAQPFGTIDITFVGDDEEGRDADGRG